MDYNGLLVKDLLPYEAPTTIVHLMYLEHARRNKYNENETSPTLHPKGPYSNLYRCTSYKFN